MEVRTCPFPNCFAQLAEFYKLPVVFFLCDQSGKFTAGIGGLLYEMHPDILSITCWDAHKDDPKGTEHYRKCLEGKEPQQFFIKHENLTWSVMLQPIMDGGGLQGMAVLQPQLEKILGHEDLGRAIKNDELEIWLQPICRLIDGYIVGHEALLRWRTASDQIMSPDSFLYLANGLMPDICLLVLQKACAILNSWQDDPVMRDRWIAINVAPTSISEGFLDHFNAICDESGIKRSRLHLEITEQAANESSLNWFVAVMSRRGHRIKIDDYGADGADDFRLSSLPVDDVKFDNRLIKKTVEADGKVSTGNAIAFMARVNLCRKFAIEIIVEGIEHQSQCEWLISQGIEFGQGYLFGRPQPLESIQN